MSDDDADKAATVVFVILFWCVFGIFWLIFKLFQAFPKPMSILLGIVVLLALVAGGIGWIGQMQAHNSQSYTPSSPSSNYNQEVLPATSDNSSGTLSGSKVWQIRLYNMDEHGEAYLNGTLVASVDYRPGDTGWIDISDEVLYGENALRFVTQNVSGGYAWGFDVAYQGSVVWSSKDGERGVRSARNGDLSRPNQTVYEQELVLHSDGSVSEGSAGTDTDGSPPQVATDIVVGSIVEVTAPENNIRSAPNADDDTNKIGKVKKGARLQVVGGPEWVDTVSDDGQPIQRSWWLVTGWDDQGTQGWCSSRYLVVVP